MQMNEIIKSVNESDMTDIDRQVSELAERLGLDSVSDIAPYVPVLSKIDISNTQDVSLLFDEVVLAFTLSQVNLTEKYKKILALDITDKAKADKLKGARNAVIKETKAQIRNVVRDRMS